MSTTCCFSVSPQLLMLVKAVRPVCRASMPIAESNKGLMHERPQHVVICGAGIIGTCTAFFLAKEHGIKTTVVEQYKVAGAASGKAGGFLARDWCDGGPSEELMQASFDLHRQLADEFGADAIGYRPMRSTGLTASSAGTLRGRGRAPAWLDGNVAGVKSLSDEGTTAQVHPGKLTHALLKAAQRHGAELIIGQAQGICTQRADATGPDRPGLAACDGQTQQAAAGRAEATPSDSDAMPANSAHEQRVTGVQVDGRIVEADAVVLALGPWTLQAAEWLPAMPQVHSQIGHSLVLQAPVPLPAEALYISWRSKTGVSFESEAYPRPDGTLWLGGGNAMVSAPSHAKDVSMLPSAADNLKEVQQTLGSALASAAVLEQQACLRPLSPDGTPVLGALPGTPGAFIATGHSCWGIAEGPATGKALAELIATGKCTCLDMDPFSPKRFIQPSPAEQRGINRLAREQRTHLSQRQALPTG